MSRHVSIIEVGPRDGLQNENSPLAVQDKIEFIHRLVDAGLQEIEAASFVSPKRVPQMADADELWKLLPPGPLYSALVPNRKGLERALEVGVDRIALFTAASSAFTEQNIGMTVEESLGEFRLTADAFRAAGGSFIRGYVSTAFECPYAGKVDASEVVRVTEALLDLGVDEISIGDTIGVAVPDETARLSEALAKVLPVDRWAYHFHDTRGTAVANVAEALRFGVRRFDASAAGLGGCPYAPGAGGNAASEDLVYFLERSGYATGIDLGKLAEASLPVLNRLGKQPAAKAQLAVLAREHGSGRTR